ncbi:MAG TPA: outer membrane protein transport protein [Minicystis sp.]|nr:outer membrane protein transport protein [Minicystis sp.]
MTLRRIDVAACALALAILSPRAASATPLLETLGTPGSNGGFSGVVSSPSAASAYFNPAMLEDAPDDVLLGVAVLTEQISVTLDGRPAGADVPLAVGSRGVVGPNGKPLPNDTVPTDWLKNGCTPGAEGNQCPTHPFAARPRQAQGSSGATHGYLLVGAVKHVVKDRATLGIYMALPLGKLTTAESFYSDEREQLFSNSLHPELYGDRLTAISIALGASFRVLRTLSVGVGTTFGLSNSATSATYVRDSSNYSTLLLNNDVGVTMALAPHFGVYWTPLPWFRAGFSLHAPQSLTIDESIATTLPDGVASSAQKEQVHDYMPWRAALGAEVDVVRGRRHGMSLTASVERINWSSYRDRHGESPSVYGQDLAWSDTMNWSVGVRHRYRAARAFMDLQYAPTPVPAQVGRSDYVDSDRLGAAIGADVMLDIGGMKVRPGISLVGYRLVWRHQTKDDTRILDEVPDHARFAENGAPLPGASGLQTNNPGWPGFGSDGWVYGGTATVEVVF